MNKILFSTSSLGSWINTFPTRPSGESYLSWSFPPLFSALPTFILPGLMPPQDGCKRFSPSSSAHSHPSHTSFQVHLPKAQLSSKASSVALHCQLSYTQLLILEFKAIQAPASTYFSHLWPHFFIVQSRQIRQGPFPSSTCLPGCIPLSGMVFPAAKLSRKQSILRSWR